MEARYKNTDLIERSINCAYWPDEETPVSVWDEELRVDWYNAGEGVCGDYNPEDPDDMNLLRFDVYHMKDDEWEEVEDASYCTWVRADTNISRLRELALHIFNEYKNVDYLYSSVKKLGEGLSWLTA